MSNIISYEHQQKNLDYLKSLAKIAADSKQYQTLNEGTLLNLMLSAHDLGISPMKAINGGFYVVNGKVCMSTSLMADRIRKGGHSIKVVEISAIKCTIIGVRKDNGDSLKLEYTWEDATLAGLVHSPTWKKFPKLMLYNRCMSSVARILFPDVLGSCYSEEERYDIDGTSPEKRPLEEPKEAAETIDIASIKQEEKLTEQQIAELDSYLVEDPELEGKITKALAIPSVYEMHPKNFSSIISTIKKRKKEKEKVNECATV